MYTMYDELGLILAQIGHVNIRNYPLMDWRFQMMLIQHSVKIQLAVQHSVKSTASWLDDFGK